MKKVISGLLIFILILQIIPLNVFADTSKVQINVSEVTTKVGIDTEVNIEVSITNNPGISGLQFKLVTDENIEYVKATKGTALSDLTYTEPASIDNPFQWDGSGSSDSFQTGTILTVTFSIPSSLKVGEYKVQLQDILVVDKDVNDVNYTVAEGKVVVECDAHVSDEWVASEANHYKVCEKCGVKFQPEAHDPTEATCTVGSKCSVCDRVMSVPDTSNHTDLKSKVTVAATHSSAGTLTYYCDDCGNQTVKTEPIPKTEEHTWGAWTAYDKEHADYLNEHYRVCTAGDDCPSTPAEKDTTAAHTWVADADNTYAATHSKDGQDAYKCECGAVKVEVIPMSKDQHDYEGATWYPCVGTDPEAWEYHYRLCQDENCPDEDVVKKGFEIQKHDFSEWADEGDGTHSKVCDICEDIRTDEHAWDQNNPVVKIPPTHTEKGTNTYTCTECDATDDVQDIPVTDEHTYPEKWSQFTGDNAATHHYRECIFGETCPDKEKRGYEEQTHTFGDWAPTSDDKQHSRTCTSCDYVEVAEHNWDEDNGVEVKAPTHSTMGETEYTCENCNATEVRVDIEKTAAHEYVDSDWQEYISGDKVNTHHYHYCAAGEDCPDYGTDFEEKTIKEAAHTWGTAVKIREATHTQDGEYTYTCTVCNHLRTVEIPALEDNHKYGSTWVYTDDESHIKECTEDGCPTEDKGIKTAKHNWNGGEVTTAPTHTADGVMTYKCADCNGTKTEAIKADTAGHVYGAWKAYAADHADYTAKHFKECADPACQNKSPITENHTWGVAEITKKATCKDVGEKTYTCTVCGAKMVQEIPVNGMHKFEKWTANGNTDMHFSICAVDGCDVTTFKNHKWTTPVTVDDTFHAKYCTVCGNAENMLVEEHVYSIAPKDGSPNEHVSVCACGFEEPDDSIDEEFSKHYNQKITATDWEKSDSKETKWFNAKAADEDSEVVLDRDDAAVKENFAKFIDTVPAMKEVIENYEAGNYKSDRKDTADVIADIISNPADYPGEYEQLSKAFEENFAEQLKDALKDAKDPLYQDATELKMSDVHWSICGCGELHEIAAHYFTQTTLSRVRAADVSLVCECGKQHPGIIVDEDNVDEDDKLWGSDWSQIVWQLTHMYKNDFIPSVYVYASAGEGGTITNPGRNLVHKNTDVTYVITPEDGYRIKSVFVNGVDIGAVEEYTFNNIKAKAMISATFEKIPGWSNPFTDIPADADYLNAIEYVYENGLFKGISPTEFGPEVTMTRAMFVTVLGRLAGVDVSGYTNVSFEDVVPGEYYAPYVEWATQNGIIMGYGDGTFGVNDQITIEQAAVIIARYAKLTGVDVTSAFSLEAYEDMGDIDAWALEAMMWIVENAIYQADSYLNPLAPAPRRLIAEMLYNFAK